MHYVYIINSISNPSRFYIGYTENLEQRLLAHNEGQVPHTSKFSPWKIKTYIAFENKQQAIDFEKYLKTSSGRAFSIKRL
ncbi:MAG: GIY-YIG nuclease family protein [Candidatus Margulisbacteria bacterium]|nr:GIY-YIG nuclease family protein [Candidatus Margulisiibacteriota bacterium]